MMQISLEKDKENEPYQRHPTNSSSVLVRSTFTSIKTHESNDILIHDEVNGM